MHKPEPLGKWSQGKAELAPTGDLQREQEPESQGTRGALVVQEQQARTEPKWPRGALTRGCAQCYRGQAATPGGHPWGPPWESRELPPPGCGARGPPSWSRSSRHLASMAQRSPGQGPCSALQRKAKNPQGHSLAHRGGKKSLPPPSCRAREAIFVVHKQQAVTQPKGTGEALASGHAQCCRGRQKTPGDTC